MSREYIQNLIDQDFFLKYKLNVSKQYAAHSHMIVKPCLLLGRFGGMVPLENLKKK